MTADFFFFCTLLVSESLDDTVLVFHFVLVLPHFNQLVCAEQKIIPDLK